MLSPSMDALPLLVVFSTGVTIFLMLLPSRYDPFSSKQRTLESSRASKTSVQILVLGDIGRSPRMQYHALSVAKQGGDVQLIGYHETEALDELRIHPNVSIIALPTPPKTLRTSSRTLFLIVGPLKVILQVWYLWIALGYRAKPSKWLLIQNPPSIPSLLVGACICFLRNTRLVIDWHNFGYSILALKLGTTHPLVQVSRLYENVLAQAAHSHFAVTRAMTAVIKRGLPAEASVLTLHDRPANIFQPLEIDARVSFLSQHALTAPYFKAFADQKLKILVSSTSWTPDEDFSVLLQALCQYSTKAITCSTQLPELLVIITGKGPQQAQYMATIEELKTMKQLEMVTIKSAWLSFDEYAQLLGSADLGLSLHTSSSGVDLPMKVVDMFGAGLPVAGFNTFEAWPELVLEGVNGRGFASASQLADILEILFEPNNIELDKLKEGALRESMRRWDDEWNPIAGRLFGLVP